MYVYKKDCTYFTWTKHRHICFGREFNRLYRYTFGKIFLVFRPNKTGVLQVQEHAFRGFLYIDSLYASGGNAHYYRAMVVAHCLAHRTVVYIILQCLVVSLHEVCFRADNWRKFIGGFFFHRLTTSSKVGLYNTLLVYIIIHAYFIQTSSSSSWPSGRFANVTVLHYIMCYQWSACSPIHVNYNNIRPAVDLL